MLPKFRELTFSESKAEVGVIPTAVRATDAGEFAESLTMVKLPEREPALVGSAARVNVVL
jgi:hypothetical protein